MKQLSFSGRSHQHRVRTVAMSRQLQCAGFIRFRNPPRRGEVVATMGDGLSSICDTLARLVLSRDLAPALTPDLDNQIHTDWYWPIVQHRRDEPVIAHRGDYRSIQGWVRRFDDLDILGPAPPVEVDLQNDDGKVREIG